MLPKNMQTAKVIILYDGGEANNLSNYGFISISPVFSKVLQKLRAHSQQAFLKQIQSPQIHFFKVTGLGQGSIG